jgi:hypothetical protein
MNINELHSFRLSDAVKFHDRLNPALFDDEHLDPQVRQQLLVIATDFMEFLGITDLEVQDITLSGSNAAYSYTPHSDLDLHLIVDQGALGNDEIYQELFNSKKTLYNDKHNIRVRGYDVELYVQDSAQKHVSLGEYSILHDRWIKLPTRRRANLDERASRLKFEKFVQAAELAIHSNNIELVGKLLKIIKKYRQAGLDVHGEFGPENLAYKALKHAGYVDRLYQHKDRLHAAELSLDEDQHPNDPPPGRPRQKTDPTYNVNEASGYIPSNAERNDPRFKTALTVDIKPDTMKQNAKKLGWRIARDGTPPLLRK